MLQGNLFPYWDAAKEASHLPEARVSKPYVVDVLFILTACWLLLMAHAALGKHFLEPRIVVPSFEWSAGGLSARSQVPVDGQLSAALLAGTP